MVASVPLWLWVLPHPEAFFQRGGHGRTQRENPIQFRFDKAAAHGPDLRSDKHSQTDQIYSGFNYRIQARRYLATACARERTRSFLKIRSMYVWTVP